MTDNADSWLEEVDTSRSSPGSYVLNGKDRKYCLTGEDQGSIKNNELESRIIEDRIQNMQQRLQDLFDDIALIHYSDTDFLSSINRYALWRSILNIRFSGRKVHIPDYHFEATPTKEIEFGTELGCLLRYLHPDASNNLIHTDLVWGFLQGLHGYPINQSEKEAEILEELFSQLNEKRKERKNLMKEMDDQDQIIKKSKDESYNILFEIFKEEGVDNIDTSINWHYYLGIHPYSTDKSKIRNRINNHINVDLLIELSKIQKFIEDDITIIINKQWRKQNADKIIEELWLNSQLEHKNMIRVNDLNTPKHHDLAKKLINEFSSKEKHGDPTHYPIIKQKENRCKLTEYGKLVSYCLFENGKSGKFIQKFDTIRLVNEDNVFGSDPRSINKPTISDEERRLIKNVLNEIDSEIYDH